MWIIVIIIIGVIIFYSINKENKNQPDKLIGQQEIEAAEIFTNLVNGFLSGNDERDLEKMSIGLYYLSFKRTNKKTVTLEEIANPFSNINNFPNALKNSAFYSSLYATIKDELTRAYNSYKGRNNITFQKSGEIIASILYKTAQQIESHS
jgi:hypothetical protein